MTNNEIDFPRIELCNSEGLIPDISSLQKVAGEQVVSLKGEIAQLSGIKYLDTLHHGKLEKQEVILRDATSSIKLILWEDYVESLELNKTYLLKNLHIKVTKKERYLYTSKTEMFACTEEQPFTHPLVEVDQDLSVITSTTWTARILGIQQASYVFCGKTVTQCQNAVLGEGISCKISQVFRSCLAQWFLRVLVQNVDKTEQK